MLKRIDFTKNRSSSFKKCRKMIYNAKSVWRGCENNVSIYFKLLTKFNELLNVS